MDLKLKFSLGRRKAAGVSDVQAYLELSHPRKHRRCQRREDFQIWYEKRIWMRIEMGVKR